MISVEEKREGKTLMDYCLLAVHSSPLVLSCSLVFLFFFSFLLEETRYVGQSTIVHSSTWGRRQSPIFTSARCCLFFEKQSPWPRSLWSFLWSFRLIQSDWLPILCNSNQLGIRKVSFDPTLFPSVFHFDLKDGFALLCRSTSNSFLLFFHWSCSEQLLPSTSSSVFFRVFDGLLFFM